MMNLLYCSVRLLALFIAKQFKTLCTVLFDSIDPRASHSLQLPGVAGQMHPHATKESIIESSFMTQARIVNTAADHLGYQVAYTWGGSNMSKSQCDLLAR